VYRIVLTGGPCSGKSTALSQIADHFRSLPNWNVYMVPEAATVLFQGGVAWDEMNDDQKYSFQLNIFRTMMTLEDTFVEMAHLSSDKTTNKMVLCDRGVMDGSAYVSADEFGKMLQDLGVSSVDNVKDNRYDLVVHLVTAAEGREEFYAGRENNAIRSEEAEKARQVDKLTLNAWMGHPHLTFIDNRTLFKEKVMRAVEAICKRVNVPTPSSSVVKRKFLVSACKDEWVLADGTPVRYRECSCLYTYLEDVDGLQQRVRQRSTPGGMYVYTHIVRRRGESGSHERYTESAHTIGRREYETLVQLQLEGHDQVRLKKRSFLYKQSYFQLAVFEDTPLMLLETYDDTDREIELPADILTVVKEVTKLSEYSMVNIAKKFASPP